MIGRGKILIGAILIAVALIGAAAWFTRDQLAAAGAGKTLDSGTPGQASPPDAPGGSVPIRTETTTYDNWTLICRTALDAKSQKTCYGELKLIDRERQATLLSWIIGRNQQSVLHSVFQTPTGVEIGKGAQLRLAPGKVRTLPFVVCETGRCEAALQMDPAVLDEVLKATEATLAITVTDGRQINFNMPLKGIANIIAEMGR
jgi:invasion protein IalB